MKKKIIVFVILAVVVSGIAFATTHITTRADCKYCACTYFKCKGDRAGVCYCTCGHSCRDHIFPNSYVQEYKRLYDKAIANAEQAERSAEKCSSYSVKNGLLMNAREFRRMAQEYLDILNKIK